MKARREDTVKIPASEDPKCSLSVPRLHSLPARPEDTAAPSCIRKGPPSITDFPHPAALPSGPARLGGYFGRWPGRTSPLNVLQYRGQRLPGRFLLRRL
ncbi:hypothetical protein QTO34_005907 [Cnephaeus nilssonii]|uniref:Uncharacterized protein n=1 Tax=Cnephaeus nilssonii TaxID=3371016 RepID=A0AA40HMH1_CNENI|nr:hypothetical protein QTO34_005907 [Eptesicus nilssonii]